MHSAIHIFLSLAMHNIGSLNVHTIILAFDMAPWSVLASTQPKGNPSFEDTSWQMVHKFTSDQQLNEIDLNSGTEVIARFVAVYSDLEKPISLHEVEVFERGKFTVGMR